MAQLFDVVEVDLITRKVDIVASNKTFENAEAVSDMAVMRRGIENNFFAVVPAGSHAGGDMYKDNSVRGE